MRKRSRLNLARKVSRGGAGWRILARTIADPSFPRTFFERNLLALHREPSWVALPLRVRKAFERRLLRERCRFFLETRNHLPRQRLQQFVAKGLVHTEQAPSGDDYCDHCGGCCEIASGLAEFPDQAGIPHRWHRMFGEGLGRWHRFCAFLWEMQGSGRSLCAIHPWRPLACRAFEREECLYLKNEAM